MENLCLKKDGFISIHPVAKIITFFSCSLIMMNSGERLVENVIIAFLLLLLFNAKFYGLFLKFLLFSTPLVVMEVGIIHFHLPILMLTIIKFIKMFIPGIISYYLIARGTTSLEIMTGLHDIHFPKGIVIPIVVMIRFIPTVIDSLKDTMKALRIKGITKKSIIKKPIQNAELILVPVLMTCVQSMDELAAASISRGFSLNNERTYLLKLSLSVGDFLIYLFFIGMIVLSWRL